MNQIMALKGAVTGSPPSAARVAMPSRAASISVEIRPLPACAEIRGAWSDLASRALEPNLFFEPDFALPAAQHLIAFRDAFAVLVWDGPDDDPGRRLLGLIPCFPRNRLFAPDQLIGFSNGRVFNGAPLLDADRAQEAIAAVLGLRGRWMPHGRGCVLRRIDLDGPLIGPVLRAAKQLGLAATLQPPGAALPLTPEPAGGAENRRAALSRQGRLALVEAGSRIDARDAVEFVLAMQASGPHGRAGTAVLQDTREAAFLRTVTRTLTRARQCRIGLLTLDSRPVAGAIVLGRARRGWLYLAAHDESYAPFAPETVLLAMMRQAAPARLILDPALPAIGPAAGRFGEIRLAPQGALRPRDLASRARDALARGFRPRRAGAAG
jgi:hypothetical protein